MKLLVTGFDPFGGESVNPAYEAVKLLPDIIEGAQIIKLEIPTVFTFHWVPNLRRIFSIILKIRNILNRKKKERN